MVVLLILFWISSEKVRYVKRMFLYFHCDDTLRHGGKQKTRMEMEEAQDVFFNPLKEINLGNTKILYCSKGKFPLALY